jgi:amino-acid N-acetyltransferase
MIRKATIQDIKEIHLLLSKFGEQGLMLSRPLSELYDHARDFSVFVDPTTQQIAGCCALQFCWEDLAEVRSLAVKESYRKQGVGRQLVSGVLEEATSYAVKRLFTLTYRPDFFERIGFVRVDRSRLPLKIWTDCISCVKFPDCDEVAMMKPMV